MNQVQNNRYPFELIKFRAWDKIQEKMRSFDWLCINRLFIGNLAVANDDQMKSDFVFMLWTGTTDKYDDEIYVGDFVKTENGRVWEIKFGQYKYALQEYPAIGFYIDGGSCQMPLDEYPAVARVGNIYDKQSIKDNFS